MDEKKAYRKEIWLTVVWVVLILFVDINPIVYWKGIMDTQILGFPGQYGFYLLNLILVVPALCFLAAYLGNNVELEITGQETTGDKKK